MENPGYWQTDVTIHRRGMLRLATGLGMASFPTLLSQGAEQLKRRGKSCVLLWMQGGPSQFETFSPKPDHPNGGETKAIATQVPGIEISQHLPQMARVMEDVCLLRSMNSKEGSHPRAQSLLHTGYLPTASVQFPTFGAHAAHQLGDSADELPNFVKIGRGGRGGGGGGLLGVAYDPFVMSDASRMPENTTVTTTDSRYRRRLKLRTRLENQFAKRGSRQEVNNQAKLYRKASRMVLSPSMEAFDISREPESMHTAYGSSAFGKGCLLARRLLEAGVTFVEVVAGNWDTHLDNFSRTQTLCQQIDQPYSQLLRDLKQRGVLEKTLIIWMGEFGRTPRINPRGGRDHFPRAFNVALSGAGIRGGQVIGRTNAGGTAVSDRPITVPDLFQTFCRALDIDPEHENLSGIGRPIKIVDGGSAVTEVFA